MARKPSRITSSESSVLAARAQKSERPTARHRLDSKPNSKIDFSDIPELTDEQLKRARRVGRPTQGNTAKQLIAIRLDPELINALREKASERQIGYQSLIQELLAKALAE